MDFLFDTSSLTHPGVILAGLAFFLVFTVSAVRHFLPSRKKIVATSDKPFLLQFPPSRRHVLASLSGFEKSNPMRETPPKVLSSKALPTTTAADLNKNNQYTPTGFSTQEIRALGRFPDYSILSGVRHPIPVSPDWDITKATFRPYRPFRWNYHQHMGRYLPNHLPSQSPISNF